MADIVNFVAANAPVAGALAGFFPSLVAVLYFVEGFGEEVEAEAPYLMNEL